MADTVTNEVRRLDLDHLQSTSHDGNYEVCKCNALAIPHVHAKDGIHGLEHYDYHLGDTKEVYREEVRQRDEEAAKKALAGNAGMTDTEYEQFKAWKAEQAAKNPQKPAGMSDKDWADLQEFRATKVGV